MENFEKKINQGKKKLSESSIIVCGIVRDCSQNLKKNIPIINELCNLAKEYNVVIYENDSIDDTKEVLKRWSTERNNIHILLNTISKEPSIPICSESQYYPYNSLSRISRMADHRNKYLEYIRKYGLVSDYVIVVDLDVAKIYLSGVITSFATNRSWDVLTANGQAISSKLRWRYFDTYALFECGKQDVPQTSDSLMHNQYKWGFLKKGMPLIKVYSAHGGLSIYRYPVLNGVSYKAMPNYDSRIEVRCEHYGLCRQIQENGFSNIYINPEMRIRYRGITFSIIFNKIKKIIKI